MNDDLLTLADKKKLGLVQGVSLSALPKKEQEMIYDALCQYEKKLSTVQANQIKQLSLDSKLDENRLEHYLFSVQKHNKKKERLEAYLKRSEESEITEYNLDGEKLHEYRKKNEEIATECLKHQRS